LKEFSENIRDEKFKGMRPEEGLSLYIQIQLFLLEILQGPCGLHRPTNEAETPIDIILHLFEKTGTSCNVIRGMVLLVRVCWDAMRRDMRIYTWVESRDWRQPNI